MMLRINRLRYPVEALGPGRRLGLWTQGCPLACKGCMAQDTWDRDSGIEAAVDDLAEVWRRRAAQGAAGITVSGGEPLDQPESLGRLLELVDAERRSSANPADIMIYTGYAEHEMTAQQRAALEHADVVITGRYEAGRPTKLIWRGSSNQRMWIRTELGQERFGSYVDFEPDMAPLQFGVDDDGLLWLVGVPQAGDLTSLERWLRESGVPIESASWRGGQRKSVTELRARAWATEH